MAFQRTAEPVGKTDSGDDLYKLKDYVFGKVDPDLQMSDIAFRRRVRNSSLPRRMVDGFLAFTIDEVRAAFFPIESFDTDAAIQTWSRLRAAEAPPMSAEQRDLLVSAFSDALSPKVVR